MRTRDKIGPFQPSAASVTSRADDKRLVMHYLQRHALQLLLVQLFPQLRQLSPAQRNTHTYITELWGHQWNILKPKDGEIVKILVLSYLCKQQQVKVWIPKFLVVSDLLSECSRAFFFPLHLLGLQQLHGKHELFHLALQLLHLGARVVVLQPEPPCQKGRALWMLRRHRRARLGGLHSGPVEWWRCG